MAASILVCWVAASWAWSPHESLLAWDPCACSCRWPCEVCIGPKVLRGCPRCRSGSRGCWPRVRSAMGATWVWSEPIARVPVRKINIHCNTDSILNSGPRENGTKLKHSSWSAASSSRAVCELTQCVVGWQCSTCGLSGTERLVLQRTNTVPPAPMWIGKAHGTWSWARIFSKIGISSAKCSSARELVSIRLTNNGQTLLSWQTVYDHLSRGQQPNLA